MDTTHLDPTMPAPQSPSDPLRELRSLGEYRILRRLGEGGMGFVYLGYHEGEKRYVAVKVLAEPLASNQSYVDRFYREARSGAQLNHPNIVRGLAVGQDQATNKHYLVLEYVDGPSAHALLEKYGRLSVGDAVHIAYDIARALEHAHSRNIVHRDIKPDNILITRSGVAKLADLGLAKRTDETSHLTAARQGFGTSYYMPYEQALNAKAVDGRSDIYALGATLYHLLTGEVPFKGENHLEVVEKKDRGEFTPASALNPAVPRLLDNILEKMMARDPRARYRTASDLLVELERSGLASPVPSFADPDLALQDPQVRAFMASTTQPTRPDLEAVPRPEIKPSNTPAQDETGDDRPALVTGRTNIWHLRHGDRKVKVTTQQIVKRLSAGRIPVGVEACPDGQSEFRPLAEYPEFRNIRPERVKRRKAKPLKPAGDRDKRANADGEAVPLDEATRFSFWDRWPLLLGGGIGVALLTGLALLYFFVLKKS